MVSECAVDPKKDEDNDVQVVSTDEKHTEFFFKPLTKEQKIKIVNEHPSSTERISKTIQVETNWETEHQL